MNKAFLIFGFMAILSSALALDCPRYDRGDPVYFPHETECALFYECANGTPKLLSCAPGTYWDARINTCHTKVDCGDLVKF